MIRGSGDPPGYGDVEETWLFLEIGCPFWCLKHNYFGFIFGPLILGSSLVGSFKGSERTGSHRHSVSFSKPNDLSHV